MAQFFGTLWGLATHRHWSWKFGVAVGLRVLFTLLAVKVGDPSPAALGPPARSGSTLVRQGSGLDDAFLVEGRLLFPSWPEHRATDLLPSIFSCLHDLYPLAEGRQGTECLTLLGDPKPSPKPSAAGYFPSRPILVGLGI